MLLPLLLLSMFSAAPEPASADVTRAKRLFDAGVAAFREGAYPVAIAAFEEAHRLAPVPAVTFSLAQAYRIQYFLDQDLEKLKRAVQLYELYLADPGKGGRRDHAAQNLAAIRPVLDRQLAGVSRSAAAAPAKERETILLLTSRQDGALGAVGEGKLVELPATFIVAPGSHRVRAEAPGFGPLSREALAIEGNVVSVEMELEALPATLRLSAPDGALIRVDGRIEGEAPLPQPLLLTGGGHLLTVTARGREAWQRRLVAAPGQDLTVAADPEITGQRLGAYLVAGLGGALLLGAGGAGLMALGAEARAQDLVDVGRLRAYIPQEANDYREALDDRELRRGWAVGLAAGAAVAVAAAAVLYFFDEPQAPWAEESL